MSPQDALWVFGHGESYTTSEYSAISLSTNSAPPPTPKSNHSLGCLSWRQTGGCSPTGARQPNTDKSCSVVIPKGQSGFCECAGGVKAGGVDCKATSAFTCAEVCANPNQHKLPSMSASVGVNGTVFVSFSLKNTGKVAGTEVAQVYIADDIASVVVPNKLLQGYERVALAPGEVSNPHNLHLILIFLTLSS